MPVTPIFLLSLPRSGSTLVQRVIASVDGVATTSEPWIALPLFSNVGPLLPVTGTWEKMAHGAITDLATELPGGVQEYQAAARDFLLDLYTRLAGPDDRYFLDKSPPYYLIAERLMATFPDAKFIFLWRNPLSIVASTVQTLTGRRWDTYHHRGDLFDGIAYLTAAYRARGGQGVAVRYEDLVTGGPEAWEPLGRYLGLDLASATERFASVRLTGRMGDPTGTAQYTTVSAEPLRKWTTVMTNSFRQAWCRRYLRWIGDERLALMGYERRELLAELDAVPATRRHLASDLAMAAESVLREVVVTHVWHSRYRSHWRNLLGRRPG